MGDFGLGSIVSTLGRFKAPTVDNVINDNNKPEADQGGNTSNAKALKANLPEGLKADQEGNTNTSLGTMGIPGVIGNDWIPDIRKITIGTTALALKNDNPLIDTQLLKDIIETGKVDHLDGELTTAGYVIAAGTSNDDFSTSIAYVKSVMDFLAVSISLPLGFIPGLNKSNTNISFVNGKKTYDAYSASATPDKPDHQVDSEVNRMKINIGLLDNYTIGYALTQYKATLDDKPVGDGNIVRHALAVDIHDFQKVPIMKYLGVKDDGTSIALGFMTDFQGHNNFSVDAGTGKVIVSFDPHGNMTVTGCAQFGLSLNNQNDKNNGK
jgi:hypothetical protein